MTTIIDGLKTNYTAQGKKDGEAVILLHGWGANIKLFDRIIKLLSEKYMVYALDMPGFGESEEPHEPWDVDKFADFVLSFIKEMKITSAHMLGHSFGGRVIIKTVTRDKLPFKPLKLILVDSAGILPKKTFRQKAKIRIFKISKKLFSHKPLSVLFPDMVEKMRKKNGSADYNAASPMMRQCLVKAVNEDLTQLLPHIKQSTLLIWGENDTATPLSDGQLMEKLIPDSGLVTVKGCGHYSFLEQPVFVERVLASFMNLEV